TGTAVGGGTILRTTDGGATWTSQWPARSDFFVGVSFKDARTGIVVGVTLTDDRGVLLVNPPPIILRTTDGGVTWTSINVPPVNSLRGVSFFNSQTGFAVGDTGSILRTVDGGVTWEQLRRDLIAPNASLTGIAFTDARNGTVV